MAQMSLRSKDLRGENSSLGRRSARLQKGLRIHPNEVDRSCSYKAMPTAKSKKTNPPDLAHMPFTVECPVSYVVGGGFEPKQENGGFENLDITYAVHPKDDWTALKRYNNFIISGETFPVGSIVYINRKSPPPRVPPPDSSEEENLKFDRENLWVAKVLEIRAKDDEGVYLRVFWLYWPDELPNGRQPYHGEKELVMSNAMDVVDVMTVTGRAEVPYWDEMKGDQKGLGQRYFRQFLDIKKLGGPKGSELSAIRQHCTCQQFYNPDTTMFQCRDCGIWNHEECLKGLFLLKINQAPKWDLRGSNPRQRIHNAKISKGDNGYTIYATKTGGRRYRTGNWEESVRCLRCEKVIH